MQADNAGLFQKKERKMTWRDGRVVEGARLEIVCA